MQRLHDVYDMYRVTSAVYALGTAYMRGGGGGGAAAIAFNLSWPALQGAYDLACVVAARLLAATTDRRVEQAGPVRTVVLRVVPQAPNGAADADADADEWTLVS